MPKRYGARRRANAVSRIRHKPATPNRRGCRRSAHAHNRGYTALRPAARHAQTDRRAGNRHSHAAAHSRAKPNRYCIHHARSNKNAARKRIALRRPIYAHARKVRNRNIARQIAHANSHAHPNTNADVYFDFDAHAQIIGNAAAHAQTRQHAAINRNHCKRDAYPNVVAHQNRQVDQRHHAYPNAAAHQNR